MRGHIYKAVDKDEGDDKSGMGLDSTNAFNALKRTIVRQSTREHNEHLLAIFEVAYKYPAPLFIEGVIHTAQGDERVIRTILSCEGVRKGDALGALFFLIGSRERGEWLTRMCTNSQDGEAVWWAYLDDTGLFGDTALLERVESKWSDPACIPRPPDDGLVLKIAKTVKKTANAAFAEGFTLLGTTVGGASVEAMKMKEKCEKISDKLHHLKAMKSQHCALVLMKKTWIPRITHHIRCTPVQQGAAASPTDSTDYGLSALQRTQEDMIDALGGNKREERHTTTAALERLPVREGGVGLPAAEEIAEHAYKASQELAVNYHAYRVEKGMRVPAGIGTPLAEPEKDAKGDTKKPESQSERVTKHVNSAHRHTLDAFHEPADGRGSQDQKNKLRSLIKCIERRSQVARQWLELTAPGFEEGSMHLCNYNFQVALARWRHVVTPEEHTCDTCGIPMQLTGPRHAIHCASHYVTPRHHGVYCAVGRAIASRPRATDTTGITREVYVGKVTKTDTNGTVSVSPKYADLAIEGGVYTGVGAQVVDITFAKMSGPSRLVRKTTESAETYALRVIEGKITEAFTKKVKEYTNLTPEPSTVRYGNVVPLPFSTMGLPHRSSYMWIKTFPVELRKAIRRAISFSLLLIGNKGVSTGLGRYWHTY